MSEQLSPDRSRGRATRRIRVALVGPSLDILGGQAVQLQRMVDGFAGDPEFAVELLAVNPRLPGALRALQRPKGIRTIVTSTAYVASLARRVRSYDIVQAFSPSYWAYILCPLPAMMAARLAGRVSILHYHSGEAPDHLARSRIAVPTMRSLADRIVVPSGFLVDVFARFGLEAHIVSNVVPVDELPYRRRTTMAPRFLSNRNLEAHYDVATTLRAFRRIQDVFPDATLTVAGDGSHRRMLEALAGELDLRQVTFLGRVAPDRMGALYDGADVYLNSPCIDNQPLSVIEAMAAGLPIVSTDAGGVPFVLTHERTGLLVPVGDHAAMGAAAIRLLQDPSLALAMSDAARSECVSRYQWDTLAGDWRRTWHELLAHRRPAGARAMVAEGGRA